MYPAAAERPDNGGRLPLHLLCANTIRYVSDMMLEVGMMMSWICM